jgi:deoxycytidylate deaminase
MSSRLIIGFTGAFGSGCTLIAKEYFVKKRGFEYLSLSAELKRLFREQHDGKEPENRRELQEFGNELRKSNPSVLADLIIQQIEALGAEIDVVVDSIRNPAEIKALRDKYSKFYLFAIFAEYDKRWTRVKETYVSSRDTFDEDEFKDQGSNEPSYGQKISTCFFEADLILSNNEEINCESPNKTYNEMEKKIDHYIKAFLEPTVPEPLINESLMAIAYSIGRRSKCLKRRVGAIIVDKNYNIVSSGFNGVPNGLDDCKSLHGECYRDKRRKELKGSISKQIAQYKVSSEQAYELADKIVGKTKVLDLCRALHAEERAIVNLVGRTAGMLVEPNNNEKSERLDKEEKYILYATTYPCNLCANKIVQAGIKKVIYYEPYPVQEAKTIFESGGVRAEPFEGVTFRAFFRAFNYEP